MTTQPMTSDQALVPPQNQTPPMAPSSRWAVRFFALVAWSFLALSLTVQSGCAGAGAEVRPDAKNVGIATAKCMWRCGLGCAAHLVAIPNPPPEMPSEEHGEEKDNGYPESSTNLSKPHWSTLREQDLLEKQALDHGE